MSNNIDDAINTLKDLYNTKFVELNSMSDEDVKQLQQELYKKYEWYNAGGVIGYDYGYNPEIYRYFYFAIEPQNKLHYFTKNKSGKGFGFHHLKGALRELLALRKLLNNKHELHEQIKEDSWLKKEQVSPEEEARCRDRVIMEIGFLEFVIYKLANLACHHCQSARSEGRKNVRCSKTLGELFLTQDDTDTKELLKNIVNLNICPNFGSCGGVTHIWTLNDKCYTGIKIDRPMILYRDDKRDVWAFSESPNFEYTNPTFYGEGMFVVLNVPK